MSDNFIQDSVRRLFAKEVTRDAISHVETGEFASDLWQKIVDAGMTKILCHESHGGIEGTWLDALPLFFQIGYTQAPVPLAQAVAGQYFASRCGIDLPADGILALAAGTQTQNLKLTSDTAKNATRITGEMNAVKWARHAHWLLIETNDKLCLVNSKGKGVSITHGSDAASLPSDTVLLEDASVSHVLSTNIDKLPKPLHIAYATITSAQITGALEYALHLAVQYAKDRVQFGKPIGKNQAIQQQLAIFAGELACSYAATTTALRDMPALTENSAPRAEFSAAVAKVTSSDSVKACASIAHQVHGAIGFTYEYPLNFATRRLWAWRAEAGGSTEWAERIGQSFINARSEQFWPHLTARILPSGVGKNQHKVSPTFSQELVGAEGGSTHA